MGIMELVKRDTANIVGNLEGFGVSMVFTNGTVTKTLTGTTSSHFLKVDPDTGQAMRGRNVHVTVSMTALTDAAYPFRNGNNEVALVGHRVTVEGVTLIIREVWPDETFGIIVCILGDFV